MRGPAVLLSSWWRVMHARLVQIWLLCAMSSHAHGR